MHGCADRNVAQRKGIAGFDWGFGAAYQLHAHSDAFGGNDVTPFAIAIAQQCNMGSAIRIVLDTLDFGDNAILVAAKINNPIVLLVPTTFMTRSYMPIIITSGAAGLTFRQSGKRRTLVQARGDDANNSAASRRSRF